MIDEDSGLKPHEMGLKPEAAAGSTPDVKYPLPPHGRSRRNMLKVSLGAGIGLIAGSIEGHSGNTKPASAPESPSQVIESDAESPEQEVSAAERELVKNYAMDLINTHFKMDDETKRTLSNVGIDQFITRDRDGFLRLNTNVLHDPTRSIDDPKSIMSMHLKVFNRDGELNLYEGHFGVTIDAQDGISKNAFKTNVGSNHEAYAALQKTLKDLPTEIYQAGTASKGTLRGTIEDPAHDLEFRFVAGYDPIMNQGGGSLSVQIEKLRPKTDTVYKPESATSDAPKIEGPFVEVAATAEELKAFQSDIDRLRRMAEASGMAAPYLKGLEATNLTADQVKVIRDPSGKRGIQYRYWDNPQDAQSGLSSIDINHAIINDRGDKGISYRYNVNERGDRRSALEPLDLTDAQLNELMLNRGEIKVNDQNERLSLVEWQAKEDPSSERQTSVQSSVTNKGRVMVIIAEPKIDDITETKTPEPVTETVQDEVVARPKSFLDRLFG